MHAIPYLPCMRYCLRPSTHTRAPPHGTARPLSYVQDQFSPSRICQLHACTPACGQVFRFIRSARWCVAAIVEQTPTCRGIECGTAAGLHCHLSVTGPDVTKHITPRSRGGDGGQRHEGNGEDRSTQNAQHTLRSRSPAARATVSSWLSDHGSPAFGRRQRLRFWMMCWCVNVNVNVSNLRVCL